MSARESWANPHGLSRSWLVLVVLLCCAAASHANRSEDSAAMVVMAYQTRPDPMEVAKQSLLLPAWGGYATKRYVAGTVQLLVDLTGLSFILNEAWHPISDAGAGVPTVMGLSILALNRLISAPVNWNAARQYAPYPNSEPGDSSSSNDWVVQFLSMDIGAQAEWISPLQLGMVGLLLRKNGLQLEIHGAPFSNKQTQLDSQGQKTALTLKQFDFRIGYLFPQRAFGIPTLHMGLGLIGCTNPYQIQRLGPEEKQTLAESVAKEATLRTWLTYHPYKHLSGELGLGYSFFGDNVLWDFGSRYGKRAGWLDENAWTRFRLLFSMTAWI